MSTPPSSKSTHERGCAGGRPESEREGSCVEGEDMIFGRFRSYFASQRTQIDRSESKPNRLSPVLFLPPSFLASHLVCPKTKTLYIACMFFFIFYFLFFIFLKGPLPSFLVRVRGFGWAFVVTHLKYCSLARPVFFPVQSTGRAVDVAVSHHHPCCCSSSSSSLVGRQPCYLIDCCTILHY